MRLAEIRRAVYGLLDPLARPLPPAHRSIVSSQIGSDVRGKVAERVNWVRLVVQPPTQVGSAPQECVRFCLV